LAVRAELNTASLRLLLTSPSTNPTFATMMSIAEARGLRIEIREETSTEQILTAGSRPRCGSPGRRRVSVQLGIVAEDDDCRFLGMVAVK